MAVRGRRRKVKSVKTRRLEKSISLLLAFYRDRRASRAHLRGQHRIFECLLPAIFCLFVTRVVRSLLAPSVSFPAGR
jgi:hypothetical protein